MSTPAAGGRESVMAGGHVFPPTKLNSCYLILLRFSHTALRYNNSPTLANWLDYNRHF